MTRILRTIKARDKLNHIEEKENRFRVGDLVTVDVNRLPDYLVRTSQYRRDVISEFKLKARKGDAVQIKTISGLYNIIEIDKELLEIINIRPDGYPCIVINNGKKQVPLVMVKHLKNTRYSDNDNKYLLPVDALLRVGRKRFVEKDREWVDQVRRVHLRVLDKQYDHNIICKWNKQYRFEVGTERCVSSCPLKLFSTKEYVFCRGTLGKNGVLDEGLDDREDTGTIMQAIDLVNET